MVAKKSIIKTESIDRFFKEYGDISLNEVRSIYYLMQDQIVVKKLDELSIGDQVEFHIRDKSLEGRFNIEHVYLYDVYEHDDLSYILVLKDFNVTRI
ncbi:hypothetical protein [uncultured Parabacteroides sp.]|jgi:hypothetical protein|uniref:hypothetical protein n=1 Tax=uncultured Parabacteroides sp. TaxID=512312 RepID=UPI0025ED2213|nr:hypothetical protein [uncultured Parabacteroides sp.]